MRKIYLIESVPAIAKSYCTALRGLYEIRVCNDYDNSLEEIRIFRPDVLIVDMTAPSTIVQRIPECVFLSGIETKLVVSTSYISGAIEKRLRGYGCLHLLPRPFTVDYLVSITLNCLLQEDASVEGKVRRTVNDILLLLGMRVDSQGFKYLLEAVVYAVQNPDSLITCEIYPTLARMWKSNFHQIERAIRLCIDQSWECRDDRIWNMYFPKDSSGRTIHVSNGVFIKRIAYAAVNLQSSANIQVAK